MSTQEQKFNEATTASAPTVPGAPLSSRQPDETTESAERRGAEVAAGVCGKPLSTSDAPQ